jgi:3-deoxy-D-manno-octulosonate 8-phosphate phosphatase (KDO 8-P phosphatase)
MQHVGYSIAVHNAAKEVQDIADWVTPRNGGSGAVRDAVEHLMRANNTWKKCISSLHVEYTNQ